jgi:hypothetical protein
MNANRESENPEVKVGLCRGRFAEEHGRGVQSAECECGVRSAAPKGYPGLRIALFDPQTARSSTAGAVNPKSTV